VHPANCSAPASNKYLIKKQQCGDQQDIDAFRKVTARDFQAQLSNCSHERKISFVME